MQVVSGIKYTIHFEADDENKTLHFCKVEIISQPWISEEPTVADFQCTPLSHWYYFITSNINNRYLNIKCIQMKKKYLTIIVCSNPFIVWGLIYKNNYLWNRTREKIKINFNGHEISLLFLIYP